MKELIFGVLVWVGFLSLCCLLPFSCNRVQQTKPDPAKAELAEFCKGTNAAPAFAGLPDGDLLTIDLQRSLFIKGKRVAFRGQLSDLYRSEKSGALMANFEISQSGSTIGVYLKCTESQLQQLHDDYQKDKNATFIIAADFDEVDPDAVVNAKGVKTPLFTRENDYSVIGTLISYRNSAIKEASPSDDSD
jgi:hypothetical protein